jgi:hypothetical protein
MKGLLDSVIEVHYKEPVTLEVEGTLFVPLLALSIQKGGEFRYSTVHIRTYCNWTDSDSPILIYIPGNKAQMRIPTTPSAFPIQLLSSQQASIIFLS